MMPTLHRLFFAVRPPPMIAARIGEIRDALEGIRGAVADDRLHVTLGISTDFDAVPDAVAAHMLAIGRAVDTPPSPIVLDRLSAIPGHLALRPSREPAGLRDLADAIDAPLARLSVGRPGWRFNPHVTLGYRTGAPFSRPIAAIGWDADELLLVHSLVGATRHVVLGRWPLLTRQAELFG